MADKFDKPLGEWIEEEVEMSSYAPILNRKQEVVGLKQVKKKVPLKTMYTQMSDAQKIDCGKGNHQWFIPDRNVHIAHCPNCKKKRMIRAVYDRIEDGKIYNQDSGLLLD